MGWDKYFIDNVIAIFILIIILLMSYVILCYADRYCKNIKYEKDFFLLGVVGIFNVYLFMYTGLKKENTEFIE